MLTPRHHALVLAVRESLHGTNKLERAEFLEELTLAVYNHVKFNVPGGGFDGRDSPERDAIGPVVDAARNHLYVEQDRVYRPDLYPPDGLG